MPLIVLSGLPASGKTKCANALRVYFEMKGKVVHLLSENIVVPKAGYLKNEYFANAQLEKIIRSDLKSQAVGLLDKENVVILDAGNYIKGYRYELYCATKAISSTQCCVFCAIGKEQAWTFNIKRSEVEFGCNILLDNSNVPYSKEIFDDLCMRFEEPNDSCRWDRPLFVYSSEDSLKFESIYMALFNTKALTPNQSTQNPPLTCTNYVFELDRITNEIVNDIIAAQKIGISSEISVKESKTKLNVPLHVNIVQLNRLRRQFLNYSKLHSTSSVNVPQLFVQFLNANLNDSQTK